MLLTFSSADVRVADEKISDLYETLTYLPRVVLDDTFVYVPHLRRIYDGASAIRFCKRRIKEGCSEETIRCGIVVVVEIE